MLRGFNSYWGMKKYFCANILSHFKKVIIDNSSTAFNAKSLFKLHLEFCNCQA